MTDRWRSPLGLAALAALVTFSALAVIAALEHRGLRWWDAAIIGVAGVVVHTVASFLAHGGPAGLLGPETREILVRAQAVATIMGHDSIGTEHLLLAILEGDGPASRILVDRGATRSAVRAAIEDLTGRGTFDGEGDVRLSPGAARAIERALHSMRRSRDTAVDERHLLVGVLSDENEPASQIVAGLGVAPSEMRATVEADLSLSARPRS